MLLDEIENSSDMDVYEDCDEEVKESKLQKESDYLNMLEVQVELLRDVQRTLFQNGIENKNFLPEVEEKEIESFENKLSMLKSSFLLADEDDKANLLEKLTKELNNCKEKLAKSNIFKEYLRIKGVCEDDKSIHLNEKELKSASNYSSDYEEVKTSRITKSKKNQKIKHFKKLNPKMLKKRKDHIESIRSKINNIKNTIKQIDKHSEKLKESTFEVKTELKILKDQHSAIKKVAESLQTKSKDNLQLISNIIQENTDISCKIDEKYDENKEKIKEIEEFQKNC